VLLSYPTVSAMWLGEGSACPAAGGRFEALPPAQSEVQPGTSMGLPLLQEGQCDSWFTRLSADGLPQRFARVVSAGQRDRVPSALGGAHARPPITPAG
jgi:hypothetical protein